MIRFKFDFSRSIVALAMGLAVLGASASADAAGLVGSASDLAQVERAKLQAEIAAFKKAKPEAFEALRNLEGYRPEVYRKLRNPVPRVGRELRRLGPMMLLPMLEALMLEEPDLHGANDVERRAVIEGIIGEVGRLKDARAAASLHAVFAKTQPSWVLSATAEAMGRLCDSTSLDKLRAGLSDPARRAAGIEGLGQCRSPEAANILAAELDATLAPEEATTIATALGNLGSSWAWDSMGESRKAEGLQVREIIAAALVRGFVRAAESRDAHRQALSMVEHPETRRIAASNGRTPDAAAGRELDLVVDKIEKRAAK
jgi:hypothetical protein